MGSVTIRNIQTNRGVFAISSWIDGTYASSVIQLILGSNPISKLEVVSALNSFNLARWQYHFNEPVYTKKYNLKVHIGTVQSMAINWNSEYNSGLKTDQKSGSL